MKDLKAVVSAVADSCFEFTSGYRLDPDFQFVDESTAESLLESLSALDGEDFQIAGWNFDGQIGPHFQQFSIEFAATKRILTFTTPDTPLRSGQLSMGFLHAFAHLSAGLVARSQVSPIAAHLGEEGSEPEDIEDFKAVEQKLGPLSWGAFFGEIPEIIDFFNQRAEVDSEL